MIGFAILALCLIASAVFTITATKPVYSVVGLLFNFVALAITYLTLQAEFLAVIQIVVYSGAILILFLFVIALLSSGVRPFEQGPDRLPRIVIPAAIFGGAALLLVVFGITASAGNSTAHPATTATASGPVGSANVFGSVGDFGTALFTTNLLPFEITAFILMVAVIGVVVLAGDEAPARLRRPRREPIVRTEERAERAAR